MSTLRSLSRFLCLTSFAAVLHAAPPSPPLVADAPIEVTGTKGGFDFLEVDPVQRRLLADHTANKSLDVFDLDSGKLLKSIPTGAAQGVAVDSAAGRYLVSVSVEKQLIVIDSKTLEKTGVVKLTGPGDAIALDSKRHTVYVGRDDAAELWVIDPAQAKVTATIAIAEGPEYAIYDAAGDRLFQNIKSNDTIVVIDAATQTVKERWSSAPAKSPHGLAFDATSHRLFCAGGSGKLAVLDSTNGKLVGSADIASGVDQIAFDAQLKRIYCASRTGVLSVLQETAEGGVVSLGNIRTFAGAKTLAVDPKTHAVWIAYADKDRSFICRLAAAL